MVARMLNLAGLHLGRSDELIPASAENPDGYWEHRGILRINDELLNELGGGWDLPVAVPENWSENDRLLRLRERARVELAALAGAPHWGWKDPRTSLTLPFWSSLVERLQVVVCVRHPLEVAESLRRRGISSYALSLSLWRAYAERILADTAQTQRVVTHYEAYFEDPTAEVERLGGAVGITATPTQLAEAARVLTPAHRHSRFTPGDLVEAKVDPGIIDLYLRLCADAGRDLSAAVPRHRTGPADEAAEPDVVFSPADRLRPVDIASAERVRRERRADSANGEAEWNVPKDSGSRRRKATTQVESRPDFERAKWQGAYRLFVDDWEFRIEQRADDAQQQRDKDYFVLYKSLPLLHEYESFFAHVDLELRRILEIGIWDGGSTVFWSEILGPQKHVAIDISERGDSSYFDRWRRDTHREDRVKTYWETSQGDSERLRQIVDTEFDGPLDLVIDDASHMYDLTKSSFTTLFPLLRPGGIYVIEDWAWEYLPACAAPDHPWAARESLTKLVFELAELVGSARNGAVDRLEVREGFAAAIRGPAALPVGFDPSDHISRRPTSAPRR